MWWLIWLVAAVLLLAGEVHTQAYYALFLAVGALAAVVLSLVGLPVPVQAVGGAAVAVSGVFAARPSLKRAMDRRTVNLQYPGMAGGLVGQRAITVDAVGDEHHHGHALLANERWLARLLLSFGGRAELLEPASWRSLAAEEAARALAKYREP